MPAQKPGRSDTIVRTPPEFLVAVRKFLGIDQFDIDLAASDDNAVAPLWITKEMDSLDLDWADLFGSWAWLNPPYDNIAPWAKKCAETEGCVAFLVPASVGSNWWRDYVHNKARVFFVNGRLTFLYADGTRHKSCYPKDLALVLYNKPSGYYVWDWRRQLSPRR